jgi:tRNA modification GTPase
MTIDTIAAQATPSGRGGVGIVRVSGPKSKDIAHAILHTLPSPRFAHYSSFFDEKENSIDVGIAIYFPAPNSFTGEDVIEFQGHGGPLVIDSLLQRILTLGARLAKPGEFSERAFLNDKMDLTQAEAIADLINAASNQAVKAAMRSLQGEFSKAVHHLVESIIQLRKYVEASIDFPEEEVDFLSDGKVKTALDKIIDELNHVKDVTQQGVLLHDGMTVVIAGKPNAGKSSLLNCLSGRESAIVTDIPGTTRDVLREQIHIDGIPLHIIDTAGLRQSGDHIEQEGIRRAWQEISKADRVLLVLDAEETTFEKTKAVYKEFLNQLPEALPLTVVRNKIDLLKKEKGSCKEEEGVTILSLSAKTGEGISLLREHLKKCVGYDASLEGTFIARRRHLDALSRAHTLLLNGKKQLETHAAGELLAEDLHHAQKALGEITGEYHSDDLLGEIFSSFCIGK